ncbi:MAG: HAD family phosphatase [Candidatus Bathyarchaeia archaeon]
MGKKPIKLIIFDLDGTLTNIESIWEHFHKCIGTWNLGKQNAEKYFKNEIDYETWAKLDSMAWAGIELKKLLSIIDKVSYVKGAKETFKELKKNGFLIGIVSAGISLMAEKAKMDLGADFAIANELEVKNGKLTGEIKVKVDLNSKHSVIREAAWMLGISMNECAVVGDNLCDFPPEAGLKIAINTKDPSIKEYVDLIIYEKDLSKILDYLIYR